MPELQLADANVCGAEYETAAPRGGAAEPRGRAVIRSPAEAGEDRLATRGQKSSGSRPCGFKSRPRHQRKADRHGTTCKTRVALLPPKLAVSVARPGETPVVLPLKPTTLATCGSLMVQNGGGIGATGPGFISISMENSTVEPTFRTDVLGLMVIDRTEPFR